MSKFSQSGAPQSEGFNVGATRKTLLVQHLRMELLGAEHLSVEERLIVDHLRVEDLRVQHLRLEHLRGSTKEQSSA